TGRGRTGGSGQERQSGGLRRAERKSEFRGTDQSRGAIQLPGVAAVGGRLCPGRYSRYRSRESSAGGRARRQGGLPERHLAYVGRGERKDREWGNVGDVPHRIRPGV